MDVRRCAASRCRHLFLPAVATAVAVATARAQFPPAGTTYGSAHNPYAVATGDFDNDGRPDIVTAAPNVAGTVVFYRNLGAGSFAAGVPFATGNGPQHLAVGDLNGDGNLDVATANSSFQGSVTVLFGNGNGSFSPPTNLAVLGAARRIAIAVAYAAGTGIYDPSGVAVADLDGDGWPDIVTANNNQGMISVLHNLGNGTFAFAANYNATFPNQVTLSDLNLDGKIDAVTTSPNTHVVSVLLGLGNGTFAAATDYPVAGAGSPRSCAIGDVDGDGYPDVVVGNYASAKLQVFLGDGSGAIATDSLHDTGYSPFGTALADFDGNGCLDAVTADYIGNDVSVFLNACHRNRGCKIVVCHDEWTLSNNGFTGSVAPSTARMARNAASWFTGGQAGRFLVYSGNFGLTSSALANTMTAAGHTWTVTTAVPFTLATLTDYDAVFVCGAVSGGGGNPDAGVLTSYVQAGGCVYLACGESSFGGAAGEAAHWNPFLNAFGLQVANVFNSTSGIQAVASPHPVLTGVTQLYANSGNDVSTTGTDPRAMAYASHFGFWNGHCRCEASKRSSGTGCGSACSFYEFFPAPGTADLSNQTLLALPNGVGGYAVALAGPAWDTPISPSLGLGDDTLSPPLVLPWVFPYSCGGSATTQVVVDANGCVYLTPFAQSDYTPTAAELLTRGPVLCPLWHDWNPGAPGSGNVYFDIVGGGTAVVITWDQVLGYPANGPAQSFQVALFPTGQIEFRYQNATNVSGPALIGFSAGLGAVDGGSVDLSAATPFATWVDGSPLVLDEVGLPKVAHPLDLVITGIPIPPATPPLFPFVLFSFGEIPGGVSLQPFGIPECFQYIALPAAGSSSPPPAYGPSVTWNVTPSIPSFLNCATLYCQAVLFVPGKNPANLLTSNELVLTFGM